MAREKLENLAEVEDLRNAYELGHGLDFLFGRNLVRSGLADAPGFILEAVCSHLKSNLTEVRAGMAYQRAIVREARKITQEAWA